MRSMPRTRQMALSPVRPWLDGVSDVRRQRARDSRRGFRKDLVLELKDGEGYVAFTVSEGGTTRTDSSSGSLIQYGTGDFSR